MDSHLKQWRDQLQLQHQHQHQHQHQQSDELPSPAKFPRLYLQQADSHPHPEPTSESDHQPPILPLFVPPETKTNSFSAYPDSKPPLPPPTFAASRFACRVGGHFSIAQWQELELQALIFRHMVAGASIPPELLQLVQKSFLNSPSSFYNSYFHPSLMQTGGYWSRGAMDPEPGRCRRTDGKKWRCSRDVVPAQKYCERHVHRGRNRSRKPVESPVPTATATATLSRESSFSSSGQAGLCGPQFTLSGPSSSLDIFQLNQGASEPKADRRYLFDQNDTSGDGKSNGRVLRHFFDDWPRSGSHADPAPCLSISTPGGNQSLDFLRLSTGNAGDDLNRRVDGGRNPSECNSGGGNQVAAMGGPLAEALRSSTGSSPTSVLHQLARSASGGSYVSS